MSENLLSRLFAYRPRPQRRPLEDYVTEALCHLVNTDTDAANRYLDALGVKSGERSSIRANTQVHVTGVGRIDLEVRWLEDGEVASLLVENKIEAGPWESDSDGTFESQVSTYCSYQQTCRARSGSQKRYVAFVTKVPVPGYSRSDPNFQVFDCYLGNTLWRTVTKDLSELERERDAAAATEGGREKDYLSWFVEFLREKQMASFENFSLIEVGGIKPYREYQKKLASLANEMLELLTKQPGLSGRSWPVDPKLVQGRDNEGSHYGAVLCDKGKTPGASAFWLFCGVSTWSPSWLKEDDRWWPDLQLNDEAVPDVELMIHFGCHTDQNLKAFNEDVTRRCGASVEKVFKDIDQEFTEYPFRYSISVVRRRPLVMFLGERDQAARIEEFVAEGLRSVLGAGQKSLEVMDAYWALRPGWDAAL